MYRETLRKLDVPVKYLQLVEDLQKLSQDRAKYVHMWIFWQGISYGTDGTSQSKPTVTYHTRISSQCTATEDEARALSLIYNSFSMLDFNSIRKRQWLPTSLSPNFVWSTLLPWYIDSKVQCKIKPTALRSLRKYADPISISQGDHLKFPQLLHYNRQ